MCHQWKSAARLSQNFHYSSISHSCQYSQASCHTGVSPCCHSQKFSPAKEAQFLRASPAVMACHDSGLGNILCNPGALSQLSYRRLGVPGTQVGCPPCLTFCRCEMAWSLNLPMWMPGQPLTVADDSTQCAPHLQTSFTPCGRGGQCDTDTSPPLSPSTVSDTIPLVTPLVLVLRASWPCPWRGFLLTLLSAADSYILCSLPILLMIPLKNLLILFVCPKIMQTKLSCNRLLRETSLVNLLQMWNGLVTESSNVNARPTSHSCWS
jgi:hypothetical protein